jgi:hypothetical protein
MIKKIILAVLLCGAFISTQAQTKGSGKLVKRSYAFSGFDKVEIEDLDGQIDIEIGPKWSISAVVDDNLLPLLAFEENPKEHALKIFFQGNRKNKRYIEDTNVRIKITLPEASVIKNNSNAVIEVKNILGRYIRLENIENGQLKASGKVDSLDVITRGNGTVSAGALKAQKVDVKTSGNGNALVCAEQKIKAQVSGNGNVKNIGMAKYGSDSTRTGNGNFY